MQKKWITPLVTLLAVSLMLYFTMDTLYAPPRGPGHGGGRPGSGPGKGPGAGQQNNPQDVSYIDGVIKEIKPAKAPKPALLTIVGKKGGKGSDVKSTFTINRDTQIFIGDDQKELTDLKVGDKVNVAFAKPANGGGTVALVIRVITDAGAATNKGGGDAPPDAPKGD